MVSVDFPLAQLVRQKGGACYGEVEWNQRYEMRLPIASVITEHTDISLMAGFNYRPHTPARSSVVIIADGICLWRLDYHGAHRKTITSHIQTATDPAYYQELPADAWQPDITDQNPDLRRMFASAMRWFTIDTNAVVWVDPPKGAQ